MKFQYLKFIQELEAAVDAVDWSNKAIYAAYMAQIYYYTSHSTRLLALGASRFSKQDEDAHLRFLKHSQEEKNHEKLAERDCKALGYSVDDFQELPSTSAFYQTQYYMIEHESPWAFLGYVISLEALAARKCAWLFEKATRLHGEKCGSFLKLHGEEDQDHIQKAIALVESRSPAEQAIIMRSLEVSTYLMIRMFKDLPLAAARAEKLASGKKAA